MQLAYFLATTFSQVGLFLDEAFFCGYILHITVNYAIASDWLLKTNLKIDQLVKTPFHRGCMGVARSG